MPNKKRLLTHDGVTLGLFDWAARTGVPASTIASRLAAGWAVGAAVSARPDDRFRRGGRPAAHGVRPCPRLLGPDGKGRSHVAFTVGGRQTRIRFGPHGSADAARAYRRFAAEWAAGRYDAGPPGDVTRVADLVTLWIGHCKREYVKRGKPTGEVHANKVAMRVVNALYGGVEAAEFDVPMLEAVRAEYEQTGWARKTINEHVARVKRMFSWGVRKKLVPVATADALRHLPAIVAGRTAAAEPGVTLPVPVADIAAVLPRLHSQPGRRRVLADMIALQVVTGLRPGELCALTAGDLDRNHGEFWLYRVTTFNKMLHKGLSRTIWLGPRAQEILADYLAAAPDASTPLFRYPPYRAKAGWTPVSRERYQRAIAAACKRAGIPVWNPHRLRHNKATDVMRRYEDDRMAAAAIGDSPEVARQVYAHDPGEPVAKRIARETG